MYDEQGDRRGLTQIEQLHNNIEVRVGVYDPTVTSDNKIQWDPNNTVIWKGKILSSNELINFDTTSIRVIKLKDVKIEDIPCSNLHDKKKLCKIIKKKKWFFLILLLFFYLPEGHPPPDSIIDKKVPEVVATGLFITMTVLASLGIVLACLFLGFNIKYRHRK